MDEGACSTGEEAGCDTGVAVGEGDEEAWDAEGGWERCWVAEEAGVGGGRRSIWGGVGKVDYDYVGWRGGLGGGFERCRRRVRIVIRTRRSDVFQRRK